jgi:hypothetical protein
MLKIAKEASVHIGEKLNPNKNPELSWCFIFLPVLIGYLCLLTQLLNAKPLIGNIEILDPSFNKIIHPYSSQMEIITEDNIFTNGPCWIDTDDVATSFFIFSGNK